MGCAASQEQALSAPSTHKPNPPLLQPKAPPGAPPARSAPSKPAPSPLSAAAKASSPDSRRFAPSLSQGLAMTSESAALGFREKLFASCGTPETYNAGEAIIEEGRESGCAVFIKEGEAVLRKKGSSTELARRKMGDMIGEMTFLLSDMPTVSVFAIGKVQVLTVSHDQLMRMLEKDPSLAGRLFKMMAATLSERISEGSAKMRSEVVAKSAKKGVADVGAQKAPTAAPHTQASAQRYRELFG